ncbi:MAG: hypothetical protein IE913_11560, partial [Halothiobacillus sp.]|nr:hypothetical protein [Halothiobacillus sp.]
MSTALLRSRSALISAVTRTLDVLLVGLGGLFAFWLRFGGEVSHLPAAYGTLMVIGGLLVALVFPLLGVYDSWRARGLASPALRVVGAWSLVLMILLISLVLVKQAETFSRLWLAQWWLVSGLALAIERVAVYFVLRGLRQRGMNHRKAVV